MTLKTYIEKLNFIYNSKEDGVEKLLNKDVSELTILTDIEDELFVF